MTTDAAEPDEGADFQELSEGLLRVHRQVAAMEASEEKRSTAAGRLLAISDASKHDVGRALARLRRFEADLAAGRVAAHEGEGPA